MGFGRRPRQTVAGGRGCVMMRYERRAYEVMTPFVPGVKLKPQMEGCSRRLAGRC